MIPKAGITYNFKTTSYFKALANLVILDWEIGKQ